MKYNIRNLRGNKLKEYKKSLLPLSQEEEDILLGTLLGDSCIPRESNCIRFFQTLKAYTYVNHLYQILQRYTGTPPRVSRYYDKRRNKAYYGITFSTYSHPHFQPYKDLFYYIDDGGKQIKQVPRNIEALLNPRALAY